MQIVIDIDESEYQMFSYVCQKGMGNSAMQIILEGKLLPKGHGKLIDADEEIQRFCGKVCGCTLEECGYGFYCPLVKRMISAPAIIEKDKKQEDNGFFDEIMDESEDGETYEKIKEIIAKVKEQEE